MAGRNVTPKTVSAIAGGKDLTINYGVQSILDNATLSVHESDRIGLVGRNGCGKSTFLKIAAGVMDPDSGEFTRRRDLITGYLPQIFDLNESADVLSNILEGADHVRQLIAEYEMLEADDQKAVLLLDKINALDGWNLEQRANALINHLHAPDPEKPVASLSGGEKRRVALCRALLMHPDFLILDEPTNHLDTGAIEWLETFLSRYSGTCLFVTHDRYFLDNIATRIVELNSGRFYSYAGNYTDYLLARAEQKKTEARSEHKRQRFLKRELQWIRRSPSARRTKSKDRIERYYENASQESPEEEMDIDLIIPPAPKLANRVIDLKNVCCRFGERTLFENITLSLQAGERLGIVGRNGLGKSTLLKVILGLHAPDSGMVKIGTRTEINFIDQERLQLDEDKSVFEEVGEGTETVRLGDQALGLRSYLRRFLFTDERINTKINQLSGGEKSRIMLAKILKRGGNVLILDEPTNDLDLNTLRLLEEALTGFSGSSIVVSHDRYFLNRVCTAILAFEGDGIVRYQTGNYDYYLEKHRSHHSKPAGEKNRTGKAKSVKRTGEDQGDNAPPRKLSYNEQREFDAMEQTITCAEEEVNQLDSEFAQADFYLNHKEDWQDLEAKQKATRQRIAELYKRWEELEAIRATYEKSRKS
ncbi:MAG: ABC-F family ATP-binding cassette domain-containing protein [Verrucomicrobiaceae bacterium]|nr:ABC-F family ATP-binding cassette domain-containing protein [Verrucomicrobiaceae bacterium]